MDNDTAIEHVTIAPCNTYKLLDLLAFLKTRAPLETLRTPPSVVYLHPRNSGVSREIRFLFKSGTY